MKFDQHSYNVSVKHFGKAHTDRVLAERMRPAQPAHDSAPAGPPGPHDQGEAMARKTLAGCFVLLDRLLKQVEDNATAQVVTAQALREGLQHVARLAEVLDAPRTRTGVVDLPTGRVQMTIREHREVGSTHGSSRT